MSILAPPFFRGLPIRSKPGRISLRALPETPSLERLPAMSATSSALSSALFAAGPFAGLSDETLARLDGAAAAKNGRSVLVNPYGPGLLSEAWAAGYLAYLNMNDAARAALQAEAIAADVAGAEAEAEAEAEAPALPAEDVGAPLLRAVGAFVNSRPGFRSSDYSTAASWYAATKRAVRDRAAALAIINELQDARALDGLQITAEDVKAANAAGSGRLTVKREASGAWVCDYCAGQYYPTEYRAAAARWLAALAGSIARREA